jgi:hypothetical protein
VAEVEEVAYGVPRAARLVGVDDGVAVARVRVGHHDLHARREQRWRVTKVTD